MPLCILKDPIDFNRLESTNFFNTTIQPHASGFVPLSMAEFSL
jgi:hypothetical protein